MMCSVRRKMSLCCVEKPAAAAAADAAEEKQILQHTDLRDS